MADETEVAPETEATVDAVQTEATEQVAEASEATESTEGQPQDGQPAEGEQSEESRTRTQRRNDAKRARREAYNRAMDEKRAAEAEAKKAADEADRLRKAIGALPEPTIDQFGGDFEKYQAALNARALSRLMDERDVQRLENSAREHLAKTEAAQKAEQDFVNQSWQDHFEDGRAKYADFEAKVTTMPFTSSMMAMLAPSENAAEVAYYLASNPVTAGQIAEMDPISQARALGRLEAQVSAPKPKTVSTAPDPVSPIKGKAAPNRKAEEMSYQEFRKARMSGALK